MGIIKIAEQETKKANKTAVDVIELEIGSMAGVELDSLEYVWETAIKDTVLENAKLEIDFIQAKAICLECETEFNMNKMYDSCTNCNSHFKNIIQGKELRVKALEVI